MKLPSDLLKPAMDAAGSQPLPRRAFNSLYFDSRNQIECNASLHDSFSDIFFCLKKLPLSS